MSKPVIKIICVQYPCFCEPTFEASVNFHDSVGPRQFYSGFKSDINEGRLDQAIENVYDAWSDSYCEEDFVVIDESRDIIQHSSR